MAAEWSQWAEGARRAAERLGVGLAGRRSWTDEELAEAEEAASKAEGPGKAVAWSAWKTQEAGRIWTLSGGKDWGPHPMLLIAAWYESMFEEPEEEGATEAAVALALGPRRVRLSPSRVSGEEVKQEVAEEREPVEAEVVCSAHVIGTAGVRGGRSGRNHCI